MSFESPIQKEKSPRPDYAGLFFEKLESIKNIPDEKQKRKAESFISVGIEGLKKEIPSLLLTSEEGEKDILDLWITDPENIIDNKQPHEEVLFDLANFLKIDPGNVREKFCLHPVGVKILQDESNQLYLLLPDGYARIIMDQKPVADGDLLAHFLDLLKRYKIAKVIGLFNNKPVSKNGRTSLEDVSEILIDQDLIGDRREDLWLHDFASKHNMTIAQYLRFRIRVKSATDAMKKGEQIPIDIDKIAQEVVDEDRE